MFVSAFVSRSRPRRRSVYAHGARSRTRGSSVGSSARASRPASGLATWRAAGSRTGFWS